MASVAQIRRLLDLLDHLNSEHAYNARQLADKVGVSRRTLFRDLRALEKLGFGVRYDERAQRYVVDGDPTSISSEDNRTDELKTLMDLGHRLEGAPDGGRTRVSELPRMIEMQPGGVVDEGQAVVYERILEGFCDRRKLRLMRSLRDGGSQVATAVPYRLMFQDVAWQLVAELEDGSVEVIPVREIMRADVTSDSFRMPPAAEVDEKVSHALTADRPSDSIEGVVVRFSADVAREIAERQWFPSQELEWLDDGQLELRTAEGDSNRIVPWVLSFGGDAAVMKPDTLRSTVATQVNRMVEQYGTKV